MSLDSRILLINTPLGSYNQDVTVLVFAFHFHSGLVTIMPGGKRCLGSAGSQGGLPSVPAHLLLLRIATSEITSSVLEV